MVVSTVLTALAGLGALLVVVGIGIVTVLGGRSREQRESDGVRRFFTDRRREADDPNQAPPSMRKSDRRGR